MEFGLYTVSQLPIHLVPFVLTLRCAACLSSSENIKKLINFLLPSEMIEIRNAKFKGRFNMCNSLRYYFGL